MEVVQLKKSCDACTNSKVKCSGGTPCERCRQRSLNCYYSPRKKRIHQKKGAVKQEKDVALPGNGQPQDLSYDPKSKNFLADWERKSWSVFFTLYKHYNSECCAFWFDQQLNKMQNYLRLQGNRSSYNRLKNWMKALNVDANLVAKKSLDLLRRMKTFNSLNLSVPGQLMEASNELPMLGINGEIPFLKVRTGFTFLNDRREEEDVHVECNQPFISMFGFGSTDILNQLRKTCGGFLPWGGDVLARLITNECDLLAYIQIMAIKFNTLGPPKVLPLRRTIPSVHVYDINCLEQTTKCMIKCAHIEEVNEDSAYLTICLEISPLTPIPGMMRKPMEVHNSLAAQIDRASGSPVQSPHGEVLEMNKEIQPFTVRKRKKLSSQESSSLAPPRAPQFQFLDKNDSLNQSIDWKVPEYQVPETDYLREDPYGFQGALGTGYTDLESKTNPIERRTSTMPSPATNITDSTQAEWLDELLGWANEGIS